MRINKKERHNKVCAVIVTYNRKDYLEKLIQSLKCQSYKLDSILIFDNFSNDGTQQMLIELGFIDKAVQGSLCSYNSNYYFRNLENSGGSGGFHKAMELAVDLGFDYLWCMDDDVLPEYDCLDKLMSHISKEARICIPSRTDDRYKDMAILKLDQKNPFKYTVGARKKSVYNSQFEGDVTEVDDMPFEGPLISCSLIREIGFPKADFFIIFDDTEYATRARKHTKILYCKYAVLHKQIVNQSKVTKYMGWKEYYGFRNQIWFDINYGENMLVRVLRPRLILLDISLRALVRGKIPNLKVMFKAYRDGINGRLGKIVEPGTPGEDF